MGKPSRNNKQSTANICDWSSIDIGGGGILIKWEKCAILANTKSRHQRQSVHLTDGSSHHALGTIAA